MAGGHGKGGKGRADLETRILAELEKGPAFELKKRGPLPKRSGLRDIERRAFEEFAASPPKAQLSRSQSSPSELTLTLGNLGASGAAAGGLGSPSGFSAVPAAELASSASLASPSRSSRLERPMVQRGFTVSQRPPIYGKLDHGVPAPGAYDTNQVGEMAWAREGVASISNPAQRQLSNHKSPMVTSFARPRHVGILMPKIAQPPGPGHYMMPDFLDPNWQQFPQAGKSFDRKPPAPSESRFGGLAKGFGKGGKGSVDFLGS